MYRILLLFCVLLSSDFLSAQITGPEQDCANATLVCDPVYENNQFYAGIGQVDDIAQGSACFTAFGEQNSVWYRVDVGSSGQLIFDLISQAGDDYDFAVYDLTGLTCPDIYDGTGLIRCSFARNTDTTGLRPGYTDTTSTAGGGQANSFLRPIDVQAGETYMILVGYFDVFTNPLPNGAFTLDFSETTATVNNPPPAQIAQITSSGACNDVDSILVDLNSKVLCNTIASDGSDFNITGPSTILVQQALGLNCNQWGETTEVLLLTSTNNLSSGSYNLFVQQGSDGNTLVNACGAASPVQNVSFDVELLDATFSSSVNSSCAADTFFFEFDGISTPVAYQWVLNGDTITQPSFTYVFPDTGDYQVQLTTFSDECNIQETETVSSTNIHVSAFFAPDRVCVGTPVDFEDASQGSPNEWRWYFEQGGTSSLQNPTYTFMQAGVYPVELIAIENSALGNCVDTFSSSIEIVPEPQLSYNYPDEICQEQDFSLSFSGSGITQEINWVVDGDTLSGDNQTLSLGDIGISIVELIYTDSVCGTYTLEEEIAVNETPFFDLGNDTLICPEEAVNLTSYVGADRYVWSTGEETESIVVDTFDVFVSSRARLADCYYRDTIYIGSKTDGCFKIVMPSAFSPNGDGLNDYYKVLAVKLTNWTLRIYNRWGELVFEEENNRFGGWDGTYKGQKMEVGVYTYYVKGNTVLGDKVDQTGILTLLR